MAVPMPKPYINLPTNTNANDGANDCTTVPIVNSTAATRNSSCLPICLSPNSINANDAIMAPKRLVLAMVPSWMASSCPSSVVPSPSILTTDDEPPISPPNSKPPNAAVEKAGSHGGSTDDDDDDDDGEEEEEEEEEDSIG